ncbi:exoribonuclease [Lithospermum erythrorhizon]|uniref:Exoribonuclease n=1 Tax=Lithospermum erythrorhizon TaxID=34254 RepID=A0AAV3RWE7_LITER
MVLVQIVKLVQTRGMSGSRGNWKEFLNFHDKKIGASLCDPARRTVDDLIAFLKTFEQEDELKFIEKVLECYSIRDAMGQFHKDSPDTETPEQRLVRATVEHPRYPIEYSFPSYEEGWVVMKRSKKLKYLKSTVMVAIDCEMVLCEDGTEALARVCAVDRHLQVKLDKFVMPNKEIADYRTEITGIEAKDLEGVTLSLSDVQRSLKKLLSHGSILVGHGLSNDLRALNLDHSRVIDTSYLFKYENERPNERPSLYNLCKSVLGFELRQKGSPHNCLDDAIAAMKLAIAKVENGVDSVIPLPEVEVKEVDMSKLLLHMIPINVSISDLDSIIPGDYTIEVKAKRPKAEKYSAFAIYKSQQEADEAFCTLESIQTADAIGRPQKSINIKTRSGMTAHIWVCKMGNGGSLDNSTSKKRLAKDEVGLSESKRSRVVPTNGEMKENDASSYSCDDHLKEIERLRKEIGERDTEIAHLNKIVVALTRKQGL